MFSVSCGFIHSSIRWRQTCLEWVIMIFCFGFLYSFFLIFFTFSLFIPLRKHKFRNCFFFLYFYFNIEEGNKIILSGNIFISHFSFFHSQVSSYLVC